MPGAPPPDKEPQRSSWGPRPIAAMVPAITRPVFRKHAAAAAQLLADWPEIVGPALAATSRPRRFAAGTLTLGCAGPVALELQHLAGPLMDRINGHLGKPLVQRLRFVQEAEPARAPAAPPRRERRPVPVANFPDGELRDALAALGAALDTDPT